MAIIPRHAAADALSITYGHTIKIIWYICCSIDFLPLLIFAREQRRKCITAGCRFLIDVLRFRLIDFRDFADALIFHCFTLRSVNKYDNEYGDYHRNIDILIAGIWAGHDFRGFLREFRCSTRLRCQPIFRQLSFGCAWPRFSLGSASRDISCA